MVKICSWCLRLAEIKGRNVVCDPCLASAYKKSIKKEEKIGEKSEDKVEEILTPSVWPGGSLHTPEDYERFIKRGRKFEELENKKPTIEV